MDSSAKKKSPANLNCKIQFQLLFYQKGRRKNLALSGCT